MVTMLYFKYNNIYYTKLLLKKIINNIKYNKYFKKLFIYFYFYCFK